MLAITFIVFNSEKSFFWMIQIPMSMSFKSKVTQVSQLI